jgi:hypothetical protein
MSPGGDALSALARSFPTLSAAPGLTPWRPEELDEWAAGPVPGSGALHAARFVLAVWRPLGEWACGPFDVMRALGAWDGPHREAFLAWANHPWWP